MCLKTYKFSQILMIHKILKVFHNEFHGWRYMEFNRLDHHIKITLKETLIAKEIYIGITNSHINQRLAKPITNEQLLIKNKTEVPKYKSIYPASKIWVLFELRYSHLSRQISPAVKENFNLINNKRQQIFISEPPNIIPNPTSTFSSTLPVHQLIITPVPAQIGTILPADLPQQPFNTSVNLYTQIPPIKVLNKILSATIVAQFVKI